VTSLTPKGIEKAQSSHNKKKKTMLSRGRARRKGGEPGGQVAFTRRKVESREGPFHRYGKEPIKN